MNTFNPLTSSVTLAAPGKTAHKALVSAFVKIHSNAYTYSRTPFSNLGNYSPL